MFAWCYHGSVDETFVILEDGRPRARPGLVGAAVDPTETTAVVEFNDLDALERALAGGEIACVLAEPALTNIGIVLPEPGFWTAVREACTRTGTLLIIDETHTLSAGPGGCTAAWDLDPDLVTRRQVDRGRRADRRLRGLGRRRGAHGRRRRGRLRGRRRRRRHAGGQRALARRGPGDARATC